MGKKRIGTKQLVPGMVIASDVYTDNDQLIIPKNSILTDNMIIRLEYYSIMYVIIESDSVDNEPDTEVEFTQAERIRNSHEFKEFRFNYIEHLTSFKQSMRKMLEENTEIDTDYLLTNVLNLMSKSRNNLHVLDMLQNLRENDDITFTHSINVSLIATVLGKWLGYSKPDLDVLCLSGLLHDIGKMMMPTELLTKPETLTREEYEIIKTHTIKGYDILKRKNIDTRIAQAALMHHERCDGSGYPMGLNSSQVIDFAKIIAIADVYEAMTASRVYRGALCPFEVIDVFETEGYQKYDPLYIMTFLENIVGTYLNNEVILSNGMRGDIIMINKYALSKPIVKIGNYFMDLTKEKDVRIVAIV